MTEPTPGPWAHGPLIEDDLGRQAVSIGRADSQRPDGEFYEDAIAEVWGGNHDAEANARLITAAPDMLPALKGVLTLAEFAADIWDDRPYPKVWADRIAAARAAIIKATEGSSQ